MEPITVLNPFVVGRYVSDHYFCDRHSETEFLIKQVINGRNVALISPRRMGKTGLIRHCFNQESLKKSHYTFLSISMPLLPWSNLSICSEKPFMRN